jgi:hypothetical protein
MNAKENHETNDQSIVIEDLSAQNAEAIQVKGGVKLKEVLITSWQTSASDGSGIP